VHGPRADRGEGEEHEERHGEAPASAHART
jgi:hypothetical protein